MNKVNILGVEVDNVNMNQAVGLVESWLKKGGKPACRQAGHYIVTPNPEFIMASQKDGEFKKVLNDADLAIPDGVGLRIVSDIVNTIPGVDLMDTLCKNASEKGFTTGFLGGKTGVAKTAAECLRKKYKKLKIVYAENGPKVDQNGDEISESNSNKYRKLKVDILFVGFGQVKQEKWIVKNLDKLPVKVAMGVGGSMDYLSGKVRRAPGFIRSIGLEWLFRLMFQPWRIKRQLKLFQFIILSLQRK